MRPSPLRWLLASVIMLSPLPVLAQATAYVSAWDTLYRLDLATGQASRIGNGIGFNDVEGLAISPQGILYGVADGTVGSGSELTDFLVRIDTTTGVGTLVGAMPGLSGQGPNNQLDYGLAFTCDGKLWASSDTTGLLWEVDPSNATVREVGNTGAPLSGLGGRGNQLYGIGVQNGFGDRAQQALYRIDPSNARASRIGSLDMNLTLSSSGADFDTSGTLWATLDSQPPDVDVPSRLARIDLETGQAQVVASISGITHNVSVRGMAIAPPAGCGDSNNGGGIGGPGGLAAHPVPGPGVPALVVFGLVALGFARRSLRRG